MSEGSLIVLPEPERQVLAVVGPDAKSWLNGILSCDVTATNAARGTYGFLLTKQGKIQAEVDVIAVDTGLLLGVRAAAGDDVRAALDRYLVMEDAELFERAELSWVRLHGAGAAEAAARVDGAAGSGAIDWLGIGGAALALPRDREEDSLAPLLAAGGTRRFRADDDEWTRIRIAHAAPRFGQDFGPDDNPHQAGLERRGVSWTKGCYLGQEVVCMQDMRGKLKRRLSVLAIDGSEVVPTGTEVYVSADGKLAGQITTSARDAGKTLAFARISAPFFDSAESLRVLGRAARIVGPSGPGDGSFSG